MKISGTKNFLILMIVSALCGSGCASVSQSRKGHGQELLNTSQDESVYDAAEALTAVTGSISNKDFSEKELSRAAKEMKNDPEAKTAVEAISSSFTNADVQVKYSPVTGKRYSADMEIDPETGVKLLPVE